MLQCMKSHLHEGLLISVTENNLTDCRCGMFVSGLFLCPTSVTVCVNICIYRIP